LAYERHLRSENKKGSRRGSLLKGFGLRWELFQHFF
jgi:hypothetical protein